MEIILLHGDNETQIQQVLLDWKTNFTNKYPTSIIENYSDLSFSEILNLAQSQDMFSDKKLIILKNCINNICKESFQNIFESDSENIFLFLEFKAVRKNLKIYKEIKKNYKLYEYYLKNFNLKTFIQDQLQAHNKSISPINLNYLASKLQNQINNAQTELQKIILSDSSQISKKEIDQLIIDNLETSIFELTNNLFKNKSKYLHILNQLKQENIDAIYIINMLLWQIKTLSAIKLKDSKHINPYVLRNNQQILKTISLQEISSTVNNILEIETQIKSGIIKSRVESYQKLSQLI